MASGDADATTQPAIGTARVSVNSNAWTMRAAVRWKRGVPGTGPGRTEARA
jgi:hypothetical protein